MSYFKFALILIIFAISIYFSNIFILNLYPSCRYSLFPITDISDENINLNIKGSIKSSNNAFYKISFFLTDKKKFKVDLLPTITIGLKNNQVYNLDVKYSVPIKKTMNTNNNYLLFNLEQIVPTKRFSYKKTIKLNIINKTKNISIEKIENVDKQDKQSEKTNIKQTNLIKEISSTTIITTAKKQTDKKSEEKHHNFFITFSTEMFKQNYTYNEAVYTKIFFENMTNNIAKQNIISLLKNNDEIVVSSKTYLFTIKPNTTATENLETIINNKLLPDNYFLEFIYTINGKKYKIKTPKFNLIDEKPKILLPEIPQIKLKYKNTIISEVSDDRAVKRVTLVEINKKKNLEYSKPMILIAGNYLHGIYSYTTQTINEKGFYSFCIEAEDSSGNISKTEIFDIKISK